MHLPERFRRTSGGRPAQVRHGEFDRSHALSGLAEEKFDVLVIGGGVTGVGVALDAASRGLRTALVEKSDFASGTSSKSSKLIHGGLRYLQQREIRLVYENLAERQRLLENAPHLVAPLPFLIPLFGRDGTVSKAVVRSYAAALWLYDLTGGVRIGKRHRRVSRDEALEHLPLLKTERLVAGFLYFDARADDARLTLTIARTAALSHGAIVANYTTVAGFMTDAAGRVVGARVRPTLPGEEGTIDVRASVVVNATGVWADDVGEMDEGAPPGSLRPAKGVHVTVAGDRLPCDIASVIPGPRDKRSIFVVPWPECDLTYVGTTDTGYDGPLDDPECTPEDVDYLLNSVNAVTTAGLTRADVLGVWSGLRPLLAPRAGGRLSERTSDLSRRHTVRTSPSGVITVTGGKLTTYRKMAQDTVDAVLDEMRLPDRLPCVTKRLRLRGAPGTGPGSDPDVNDWQDGAGSGAARSVQSHLAGRYGTEATTVRALAGERPELLEPVVEGLPYLGVEVVFAARCEMAQTLADVMSRRTRAVIQDARACVAAAPAVAEVLAAELGWDAARVQAEIAAFTRSTLAELDAAGVGTDTAALGERQ